MYCFLPQMSERYWVARRKEAKDIEELAWQCHHHQNRYAANRYLTVRDSPVRGWGWGV